MADKPKNLRPFPLTPDQLLEDKIELFSFRTYSVLGPFSSFSLCSLSTLRLPLVRSGSDPFAVVPEIISLLLFALKINFVVGISTRRCRAFAIPFAQGLRLAIGQALKPRLQGEELVAFVNEQLTTLFPPALIITKEDWVRLPFFRRCIFPNVSATLSLRFLRSHSETQERTNRWISCMKL